MKTEEEIEKEIWARKVLMREANSSRRLGLTCVDFVEICTERPDDAQSWEVWDAAAVVPDEIRHIAAWVWTFRR